MTNDEKRKLLSELLTGNLSALDAYRDQQIAEKLNFSHIIDAREIGGEIKMIDLQGNAKTITADELAELPIQARTTSCVKIVDTTGGRRVPEPDEFDDDTLNQY